MIYIKILIAGFDGNTNSAKILLDKLSLENIDKLYLANDFDKCASQITRYIKKNNYRYIIAFGQKPLIKSIYLERCGFVGGQKYRTVFEYEFLRKLLVEKGYKVKLSDNAGNYLCNYVYGIGLSYIEQQKLATQCIFIHIPYIKNLTDINILSNAFDEYLQKI